MNAPPLPSHPGSGQPELLENRYRLGKELGRGAVGVVYLAVDERLDRQVAVKLLHPEQRDAASEKRFVSEARAAAKLEHPGLCSVYDVGRHGDQLFLVMAYIDGVSLADLIHRGERLPIQWTISTIRQIADAMATAHQAGIVHCDLKPENVLIRRQDRKAIVMDFGLAGAAAEAGSAAGKQVLIGSPAYMSPEQARNETDLIGPPSDIYSLGVTFYEALTGKLPFDGSLDDVLARLRDPKMPPAPVKSLRKDVPPELDKLCMRMLAKPIDRRPGSMRQIVNWIDARDGQPPALQSAMPAAIVPAGPPKLSAPKQPVPPVIQSAAHRPAYRLRRRHRQRILHVSLAVAGLCVLGLAARLLRSPSTATTTPSVSTASTNTATDTSATPDLPVVANDPVEPLSMPVVAMGNEAIDLHLQMVNQSRSTVSPLDIDLTADASQLSIWKSFPHAGNADWNVQPSRLQSDSTRGLFPTVLYCPVPVDEFEMSFRRPRAEESALQIIWTDQPGISSTASASLTFDTGPSATVRWQCYQTDRRQTLTAQRTGPDDEVIIRCDGSRVRVTIAGAPPATFARTGNGKVAGFLGIRQTSAPTHIENFEFSDQTVNRALLWQHHPSHVFVDANLSYFGNPSIDFWDNRIAVMQQFGGDLNEITRPLRRGAVWELSSGKLSTSIESIEKTIHYVGPGMLCLPQNSRSPELVTARGMSRRVLDPQTHRLSDPEPLRSDNADWDDAHWNAWFDVHHRWLLQRTYPTANDSEYHLLGLQPNGGFVHLSSTGTLPVPCDRADFSAGAKQWVVAGGKQWFLLDAAGTLLHSQTMAAPIDAIAIRPSGGEVVMATHDERVIRYDVAPDAETTQSKNVQINANKEAIVYSPDGKYVCIKGAGNDLNMILRTSDFSIQRIVSGCVGVGVFTPDSRSVITPHRSDGALKVWRIDVRVGSGQTWTRDPSDNQRQREHLTGNHLP